ncbi:MAG: hypothetical protein E6L07_08775 [Verrucomicrobia bacterium]|nr:MAG: hypothetical protein E6L07_08775 [Verrucomicrobiota bacterium]
MPRELHAIRALADNDGYIRVGMIPKGTPVNLVANLDPDSQHKVVFVKAAEKLIKLKTTKLSRGEAAAEFNQLIPDLLAANKCPDFVEDKGHYFGTDLPDTDKRALIEYLKTF